MTRTGIRASAIIIKKGKILLIHRKKEGSEYWVFPGGGVEEGETWEETVLREVLEETGLSAANPRLAFMDFNVNAEHPFYYVDTDDTEVKLGGEEAVKNSEDNWFNLEWVNLPDIKTINLVPETAKIKLLTTHGQ